MVVVLIATQSLYQVTPWSPCRSRPSVPFIPWVLQLLPLGRLDRLSDEPLPECSLRIRHFIFGEGSSKLPVCIRFDHRKFGGSARR